jgi:hypothetical protein
MRTFYVIRNARDNTYLSISGNWDISCVCAEFDSKEEAIEAIGRLDGYFVIEKVYNI